MRIARSAAWLAGDNAKTVRSSAIAATIFLITRILIESSFSAPMNKASFHNGDRTFEQEADDADYYQAYIDVLDSKEGRCIHNHVTQSSLSCDELCGDNERPTYCRSQPKAYQDLWQGRGKHYIQERFSA